MNQKELVESLNDHLRAELSSFGIDPLKVSWQVASLDQSEGLLIETHRVDAHRLSETTNYDFTKYPIEVYSLEDGRIIFRVENWRGADYDNYPELFEALDQAQIKVLNQVQFYIKEYFETLRENNDKKNLSERIPTKIYSNYKVDQDNSLVDIKETDSLKLIRSMKAKVYLRNSAGSDAPDVGQFDEVGYTMVGINTGTIIPIARCDEHHRGYDLIHRLIQDELIPNDTYHPIFHSHDYVSTNDFVALQAFKTWRKLGGPNVILNNDSRRDNQIPFQLTMDDYIAAEGNITCHKGELLPVGKRFIEQLNELSHLSMAALKDDLKRSEMFRAAKTVINTYLTQVKLYPDDEEKTLLAKLLEIQKIRGTEAAQKVQELFFGMNSFKNKLHIQIREQIRKEKRFSLNKWEEVFGDLELANHLLGSL